MRKVGCLELPRYFRVHLVEWQRFDGTSSAAAVVVCVCEALCRYYYYSPAMLRFMYDYYWSPGLRLADVSLEDADIAAAVCVGSCIYQFARRVGEFLETRPD